MEENRNDNMEPSTEEIAPTQKEIVPLTPWQKTKKTCRIIGEIISGFCCIFMIGLIIYNFGLSKTSAVEVKRDGEWDGNGVTTLIPLTDSSTIAYSPDIFGTWVGKVSDDSDYYVYLMITEYNEDPSQGAAAIAWAENSRNTTNICYGSVLLNTSNGEPAIDQKNVVPFYIDPSLDTPMDAFAVYFQDNYGQVAVVENLIQGLPVKCYRIGSWDDIKSGIHDYTFGELASYLSYVGPISSEYMDADGNVVGSPGVFKDARNKARQDLARYQSIDFGFTGDADSPIGEYMLDAGQYQYFITISEYRNPINSMRVNDCNVVRFERFDSYTGDTDMIDFGIYSADTKAPIVLSTIDTETLESRVYGTISFFRDGCTIVFDPCYKPYPYIDLSQYTRECVYFSKVSKKSQDTGLHKSDADGKRLYYIEE